ncbi:MAG TPA: ECF transporter S component [Pseudoneobacillus sp.]|nr:ECF transporter S component [Pseudoneobacillus sp.]
MWFSNRRVTLPILFILIVGLLWLSLQWENNYLLLSFGLLLISLLLIVIRFEKRKIAAREMVLLAVLASIAAVGRIPFASIPSVQPTTFVIMMSGMVFGAESGFMIGIVAALASNMILGQGPWTPWQMVGWGMVGISAGFLGKIPFGNRTSVKIIFGIIWGFLFGWIMNLWSLLAFSQSGTLLDLKTILTFMAGSLMFDFMHSISNVFFILLFGDVWLKILTRFKKKYGLFEG